MTSGKATSLREVHLTAGDALLPALLALATVASTATKLRLPGVPLGIGELLLTGWLASSLMLRSVGSGFRWNDGFALRWGGLFLLLTACALLVGAIQAEAVGVTSTYETLHEAMAWAFVLALVAWFLLESDSPRAVLRFLKWFAGLGLLFATLLLVAAVLSRLLLGTQWFWYLGFRMSGWSENPNQLAALLAPLPFLAVHFRAHASGRCSRVLWTAGLVGGTLAGLATQSDALFAAWMLGLSIMMAATWVRGLLGQARTVRSILVNGVVLPLAIAAMLVPTAATLLHLFEGAVEGRASEGGQAGTRLSLWRHGLEAVAESPLIGWGPGSHSGIDRPFAGTESHNTFIDLAAQAGLPVSLALAVIVVLAAIGPIRRHALPIGLAVVATATFAFFHNCLRHPVFWLVVFGALAASHAGQIARRGAVDLRHL